MKENTSDNQNTDNPELAQCGEKINWYEKFKEYSTFEERDNISNSANHMRSINEYSHIPRISSRGINYEIMKQLQEVDNAIVYANRLIEERRSIMIEIQGNVFKVGDYVEKHCARQGDTKLGMVRIVEVGVTSEMSTKTFYKTMSGGLFYMEPDVGTNRHYNLGNREFWIENPYISKNICRQCDYYLHGNPPVCNAFHEPGVSSCCDFQDKNTTEKLKQEKRKQEIRDFCYEIYLKINIFRSKANYDPSRIVLHPIRYEHICDYLRSGMYPFGHEMDGVLIFCDTEVILSSSVPENYIGLAIDTIE